MLEKDPHFLDTLGKEVEELGAQLAALPTGAQQGLAAAGGVAAGAAGAAAGAVRAAAAGGAGAVAAADEAIKPSR